MATSKSKPEVAAPPDGTDEVSGGAPELSEIHQASDAPDRPWTPEELNHVDPVTGAWSPALKQHWPELQPAPEDTEEVTDNA